MTIVILFVGLGIAGICVLILLLSIVLYLVELITSPAARERLWVRLTGDNPL